MFKSGFITIIGRPNVGKSTLLNTVVGQKIAGVSDKAQTTRNKITFIYTESDFQAVFLDTPGIQDPKNKLGDYMLKTSKDTLSEVDVITYMVDTSKSPGRVDKNILKMLTALNHKTPVILLINKIDTIVKEELLALIENYSAMDLFDEIIPISALENDGVAHYLDTLKTYLPEGPQYYPEDLVTDQPEKFVVSELIREKALRFLSEEVPHGVAVAIESMKWREDKAICDVEATIYVERDSHKAIVIGKGGKMLKKIGTAARREIELLLDIQVNLRLWVKVEKNWREKDLKLKNFGYE
ncbi:GTPase Era [Peptoniphilus equinus]|uniref:GTPase Era n=1 Tax=Peptoniphilus equinus TaxID=3016343 RepID=A0ABY7QUD3_9FIRM|nr:GTPase Era [Peptoniphilus equinus]WBW50379.1 GTPase Era [Peptoniphilus equinus]